MKKPIMKIHYFFKKNQRFLCLFFASICIFTQSFAQKTYIQHQIDNLTIQIQNSKKDSSQIKRMCDLASAYKNVNAPKGLEIANTALNISIKNLWTKWIAHSFFTKAQILATLGNYPESISNFNQSIASFSKLKDGNSIAEATIGLSDVYSSQGQFTKTLELIYKSLSLAEKNKNYILIAKSYQKIGNALNSIGEGKNAIKNYLKAKKFYEELKDSSKLGDLYIDIGHAFYIMGNNNDALEYFLRGEALCQNTKNYRSLVKVYSYLGVNYSEQNQLPKAIDYFDKAINLEVQDPFPYGIAFTYIHCANAQMNRFQATKDSKYLTATKQNLDNALKINKELKNTLGLYLNYFALSQYYKLIGDYKTSLECYKEGVHYNDIIYNSVTKETTKNIEYQRNIELKEKELKIKQLEINAKEKQKWYYLSGIILLMIIGGLLYYQNLLKKKTNEKLMVLNKELDQSNKIKLRFFSIINHDLRGPIASFISFFNLQLHHSEFLEKQEKNRLEQKMITDLENLLESMEDILIWSKGQMDFLQLELSQVNISELFIDIEKLYANYNLINITFDIPKELTLKTDENYLKTIIRNLSSNAIKATANIQNPTIVWNAIQKEDNIILTLSDNGKGANNEAFKALYDDSEVVGVKTGLGLHLIRDLAHSINCKIEVASQIEKGTTFSLFFKNI
jgi:signal transduction histidine kinase